MHAALSCRHANSAVMEAAPTAQSYVCCGHSFDRAEMRMRAAHNPGGTRLEWEVTPATRNN